jgi:hypothetical protein
VVNSETDAFQDSESIGGTAVTITGDGTGYTLPYKVAVISVTPQAGESLTSVNLNRAHTDIKITYWLDISANLPNCTTLKLVSDSETTYKHRHLERFTLESLPNQYDFTRFFRYCTALRCVEFGDDVVIGDCTRMFEGCSALRAAPALDLGDAYTLTYMFSGCTGLAHVPAYDTGSCDNFQGMFYGCTSLESVPLFDSSFVANFSSMFYGCTNLKRLPDFDFSSATTVASMLYSCVSLPEIPAWNLSNVTTATDFAAGCSSLQRSQVSGITRSHSYYNGSLSYTALNEIFTNLGTAALGAVITYSGNGSVGDPSIFIAKGWGSA